MFLIFIEQVISERNDGLLMGIRGGGGGGGGLSSDDGRESFAQFPVLSTLQVGLWKKCYCSLNILDKSMKTGVLG